MRLKRLEIYGFKSFADRTVVVFDNGITGIVGPNGSGKSNLSDAVRWVLGEQSAKALRGGRMEDVIFNGTQKRKRLGYCEVSLVFDNEDHALPVDFAEVMITRRVYRSGEGEYYINKAACRLKDIIELFRDTGVGKEGYSIIGQGRIDEILSQKSEDRRGVFEEAAGIVKYRARKEESEKRLANMRDNLSRVEDIIAELESQLEPLAKASETARRYLALRDELRTLECSAFVLRSDRAKERIADAEQMLTGLRDAIAEEERRAGELSAARDQASDAAQALEGEVSAAHDAVLELTREKEAREGELGVLRAEISRMEKDVLSLSQDEDIKRERSKVLEGEIAQCSADTLRTKGELTELGRSIAQKERELADAQEEARRAEEELEAHKSAIIEAVNRLSDVRTSEARLSTMRKELERRSEEAESQREELAIIAQRLQQQVDDAGAELEEAKKQEAECARAEEAIEAQIQETGRKIAVIQSAISEASGQKQAAESRLRVLREMERDYAGYQQAVKQVLLHARGNAGVHGVVASLMRVPKELERAVEAVLGGALQNVVTSDEYVARDMIAYLRQNKLGRATFLPLTTISGRTLNAQERQLLSMPGCVGLASELVGFEPQYRGIVENLLGRTVVAQNLDAGIEIMRRGHHAFRLVTLEGDVMHSGGSMTGGSSASRMTSLLSREREIKEHEALTKKLAEQLANYEARLQKGEAVRQGLKERRTQAFDDLHQAQIDVSIASERVRTASQQCESHAQQQERCELLRAQIAENLAQIDAQLAGARDTQEGEQKNSDEMNRRTGELSDALYAKREALDALREQTQSLRLTMTARERDLNALTQDAARMRRESDEIAAQIGQAQENREQLTLRHQASTQQLAQDERESAACAVRLREAGEALQSAQSRRNEAQENVRSMTQEIDALRETLAQDQDKCHKAEMVLSRTQSELAQMQQRIWEEYELTYAGARDYLTEPFDLAASDRRTGDIRREIRAMGPVNVTAVEDYRACRERYDELTGQRDDLLKAQDDLQGIISALQKQMERQFMENFRLMQQYLSETFVKLFGGGQAELRLMDENDVLGCGIEIVAQPPGKKLQLLSLLSGGERALTAIAILFAMLRLKPTPFCFLDEIEAALDDGNISTFADYLRDFSKDTQFVVVTHRKGTMERCDSLYGVAMEEKGVSKMLSVELKDVGEDAMV
ncbi:MAG: chromosome segregation protein SMC [Clostridiales bacterium]|nr:chromosome segregation protein SMC [Clostridiales bacterium]MDY5515791.1 chromosome segregation protein SMC [Candidatus Ventricola sp.]